MAIVDFEREAIKVRLGLVLGGGAMRAAAHIGILKSLEGHGIKPDIIAGSDTGGIIAAMYASGVSPANLESLILGIKGSDLFDPAKPFKTISGIAYSVNKGLSGAAALLNWASAGFIDGDRMEKFFTDNGISDSFEKMDIPCMITAVDIDRGNTVLFTSRSIKKRLDQTYTAYERGPVALSGVAPSKALIAGCSVPGLFAPYMINGARYIDGCARESLPIEPIAVCAADIIAVDVGDTKCGFGSAGNVCEVVMRTLYMLSAEVAVLKREKLLKRYGKRLVVVKPRMSDMQLTDLGCINECINSGYDAMEDIIPLIIRNISE